jgi:hypothetical protein
MQVNAVLSFSVETRPAPESARIITPVINGVPLTKLVAAFEASRGFEPAGAYDGILPDHFNYGPLESYFRGETDDRFWAPGVWVLACQCGDGACWPLQCKIRTGRECVVWEGFEQPFRHKWDYSGFGPFTFALEQYEEALLKLKASEG